MIKKIDRVALYKYVNKKIKRKINHHHVFSVIAILFDELSKDIRQDKEFKIINLGIFGVKRTAPRKYFIKFRNKHLITRSKRKIFFKVANKFKKKLISFLDIDKMIKNNIGKDSE
jgi:nucleoid DNA-binding protein